MEHNPLTSQEARSCVSTKSRWTGPVNAKPKLTAKDLKIDAVPEDGLEKVAKRAADKRKQASSPVGKTKPARERVKQNGVTESKPDSKGAIAWVIADKVRKANPKASYKEHRALIIPAGELAGEKKSQMSTETSSWAKFHGLR